jgi:hypothetical protein
MIANGQMRSRRKAHHFLTYIHGTFQRTFSDVLHNCFIFTEYTDKVRAWLGAYNQDTLHVLVQAHTILIQLIQSRCRPGILPSGS